MLAAPVAAPALPPAPAAANAPSAPEADAAERPFAKLLGQEAGRRAAEARPAPGTRGPTHDGGSKTAATDDAGRLPPAKPLEGLPAEAGADASEAAAPADEKHADTAADPGAWAGLMPPQPARTLAVEAPRTPAGGPEANAAAAARGRPGVAAARDPAGQDAAAPVAAQAAEPRDSPGEAGFVLPTPVAAAPRPAAPEGPIAASLAQAPVGSGAPVAEAAITAHPASPAFASELSTRLTTFVRDGVEHARLELHPVELGPVTVQIQLDGAQAQVHLAAEQAPTRQALEQALPVLAASLRDAGLTLSGGGVFEQPRQPAQDGGSSAGAPAGRRGGGRSDDAAAAVSAAPAMPRRRGVVDLVA